jgi:hypothetical protein
MLTRMKRLKLAGWPKRQPERKLKRRPALRNRPRLKQRPKLKERQKRNWPRRNKKLKRHACKPKRKDWKLRPQKKLLKMLERPTLMPKRSGNLKRLLNVKERRLNKLVFRPRRKNRRELRLKD